MEKKSYFKAEGYRPLNDSLHEKFIFLILRSNKKFNYIIYSINFSHDNSIIIFIIL